jgi:hypothetical protein
MNIKENIWLFIKVFAVALILLLIGSSIHPLIGVFLFLLAILLAWWLRKNKRPDSIPEDNYDSDIDNEEVDKNRFNILLGIILIFIINIAAYIPLAMAFAMVLAAIGHDAIYMLVPLFLPMPIGLIQLLYVIPLVNMMKKSRESMLAKGIVAGAIITALLNGGYYLTMIKY